MHARRQAAWRQGLSLVVATVAVAALLGWRLQRPFDADTLAIPVGQLQSQAREGAVLAQLAAIGQLAPGFARRHARQLADRTDAVARKFGRKPAQPAEAKALARASRLAAALQQQQQAQRLDPRRARPELSALARAFAALHRQLQPGG